MPSVQNPNGLHGRHFFLLCIRRELPVADPAGKRCFIFVRNSKHLFDLLFWKNPLVYTVR